MVTHQGMTHGRLAALALAFGSALGIPRGYTARRTTTHRQSTASRIELIDAANAKRARKCTRNLRNAERGGFTNASRGLA